MATHTIDRLVDANGDEFVFSDSSKADKVSGATSGNFAGLDSNGNLMDSGSKASDFATSEQGRKADSAIQGVKVNNTTLTPDANKVVTVPLATTSADGAISAADKTKLDGIAAGAEANVQADWNVTDSSSDAFIKNKPQYKYYSTTSTYVKICSFPLDADGEKISGYGIDILYRRYLGEVHGRLLYKKNFKFYCEYTGNILYTNQSYSFYYVVNSNKMDVYAKRNGYATLNVAPLTNIPKDQVDFTNFGTEVSSLPDGATEITPVWVVNSSSSSGTAPVKVNAYGGLTPVPMDSTPTASSTNLMTSGAIKTALDGKAASSHTHGNIQNGGALQTTDVVIANGDKLVITDASDSNKVARASIAFDGSTTTKALTPKGTFEAFAKSGDITTAIQALDVSSVGGDGKYISAISETDGKISATATTMDTTPTANSTKAVTSGGIKAALEVLQSNIDTADAKGIVINEIGGENVICFE